MQLEGVAGPMEDLKPGGAFLNQLFCQTVLVMELFFFVDMF